MIDTHGPNPQRTAGGPTMLLRLDTAARRSLHRQVYDGLREAILARRLPPGARLPSTRALAADLGVARNTVVLAFEQLRVEGYVVGRRGGGTRVRDAIPDALLSVRTSDASALRPVERHPKKRPSTGRAAPGTQLSARGAALEAAGAPHVSDGGRAIAFRLGVPALGSFPTRLWSRLETRRWRRSGVSLGYADAAGDAALRAAIAAYVVNARGARCSADQVLVVNGAQQALDLVARILLDPGDAVWIEDPGYYGARMAFAGASARLVPVPVDAEGLDVGAGELAERGARIAYVTPSHQFPLGAVMSAPRRLALLSWARRASAWVIEDDYDSEFRYEGRPLPCLQGVDAEQRGPHEPARVLYIGTFSKTLAPGLRLGYLIVPDELVDAFRAARSAIDRHAQTLAQGVLADFIAEGHYTRHVRRVRTLYGERQSALLAAAEATLGGLLTLRADSAGLHLVGWLAEGIPDAQVAEAAAAEGVVVSPLSRHVLHPSRGTADRNALLLGYAGFDRGQLRSGVRRLRRAIERCASAGG